MSTSRNFRLSVSLFGGLVFCLTAAGCMHIDGLGGVTEFAEFNESLTVTGPVDLEIGSGSGRIFVDTGDSDRVEIWGSVQAHGWTSEDAFSRIDDVLESPPIQQAENRIRIGGDPGRFRDISINYEIRVPADATVRATTGSGRIEIRGIVGEVETRTGSGSITLEAIGGLARAETGSGRIEGRDLAGGFTGGTGSGGVTLRLSGPGDVRVRTGSGRIEIEGVDGAVRAESGSGGIEVSGIPSRGWDVVARSGAVRLELPVDAGFELAADAPSGGIEVDPEFAVETIEVDGDGRRSRRFRGEVGGGGPRVEARTNSGGIRVLPRY